MKKIDSAVRRECVYIAAVTLILSLLMQAVFLIGGWWDYTVLLGNLWGAVIAVGNFLMLAASVTRAVGKEEKEAAEILRASRTTRTFLQFLFALIGVLIPVCHLLAVLIPLFFPRIGIALYPYVLKKRGGDTAEIDEKENNSHE